MQDYQNTYESNSYEARTEICQVIKPHSSIFLSHFTDLGDGLPAVEEIHLPLEIIQRHNGARRRNLWSVCAKEQV
jgi:hypothetical protein